MRFPLVEMKPDIQISFIGKDLLLAEFDLLDKHEKKTAAGLSSASP